MCIRDRRILSGKYDVVILNYANCDMVGHTGVFPAAVKAVEMCIRDRIYPPDSSEKIKKACFCCY